MNGSEFLKMLQETYSVVKELSRKDTGMTLLLRHRELKQDLVYRFSELPLPAYEYLKAHSVPHVSEVYDMIPLDDGTAVLEAFADGNSVNESLVLGLYSYRNAAGILSQIASGLAILHEAGIVHRDIKASHVIVQKDRNAVLVDFDASRLISSNDDTVRLGTIGFAAPEQYIGSSNVQADVYALGILLNLMMTGRHPSELLVTHRRARQIVLKATAVSPEARFASVREFAEAL